MSAILSKVRHTTLLGLLVMIWMTAFGATPSFAQAWKVGKTQLMSGKYPAAEATLIRAYKSSRTPAEKAETLKFLGVAQYMQHKQSQAASSFKNALKLNPRLKLTDSEVADESVLPFFERQRGSQVATTTKPKGIAARAVGAPGMARGSGMPAANSVKKSKKTLVKVNCNVPAQISIDGIAYGSAGSDIEIKPGEVVLELTSPGYIKKAVKIKVAPFTANVLTVNLEKPQPKATPKPHAVAKNPGALPLPSTGGGKSKGKKASGSKSSDLFGPEEDMDEFAGAPAALAPPSVGMQSQQITPPAAPAQPLLPPGAYGSPYQQQPMYMTPQQPMYQQPMYQQPMYQQPLYQQPMYQQPMYAPPPMSYPQPQPYQQQPPSIYNPYGGGGAYQAPVAPPVDPSFSAPIEPTPPSAGLPTVAGLPEDPGMPPPIRDPGSTSRKKTAAAKKSGGCSTFIKLLPFGAGQFCQGSVMKGVLFLGAEGGALFFWKQNSDAAATYRTQLANVLAERETNRAGVESSQQAAYDQETADKETTGNATIAKADSNATMSLAVFGGAWAIGVVDAFVFPPTPKAKKAIKRSRLSLELDSDIFHNQKPLLALQSPLSMIDAGVEGLWYAGYMLPTSKDDHGSLKVGVAWDL